MLLKEIKNIFHKELDSAYSKEEVDSFFYLLIEHYLGLERFVLALQPNLTVTKEEEQPLFEALTQLRQYRPIQYIIGNAHFMEMDFKVDENVLVPRPETEELVRWIIEDLHGKDSRARNGSPKILDIGTGSGCIAVSLAKNLPAAEVFALDISEKALAIAQKNAGVHRVCVEFLKKDILNWDSRETEFDIIVSNPPYVREQEKGAMHKNVTSQEPELALFVSNENPLQFYEAIARFAMKGLKENGSLYLEINQYLAKETEQLLKSHNFSEIELRNDMFGNERMIKCSYINL
ncbi:peptide chain release factor N(5)-glutamine methyltransferase [Pricia sp. S334]|uniref:peptide chain release factor N(5)-glutamine methyltransferase n=1 Tax=Pricia mediterranea TaxID=3076079 RepID=A0ABU3LAE6_9FLAO|nr:peptide chain release factor N(5)-glutamine methyltransferase [Pricia sp. S334]MDT7830640.1 peptide chain release factor N(5)-glutamine methyltransferase [Pricia sp. S334]